MTIAIDTGTNNRHLITLGSTRKADLIITIEPDHDDPYEPTHEYELDDEQALGLLKSLVVAIAPILE